MKHRPVRKRSSFFTLFLYALAIVIVAGGVIFSLLNFVHTSAFRTNFLLVNTTYVDIVSVSADFTEAVSVTVPLDTVIDAAYGYGKYSIEAILKLDAMEKANGTLILQSLSNQLGVPLDTVIVQNKSKEESDLHARLRSLSSFRMPFKNLNPAKVVEIDLAHARYGDVLPDGSKRYVLDLSKVDYTIGNAFFDSKLRIANRSVYVLNTTQTPLVGQSAARLLSHVGVSVLSVGNSTQQLERCRVVASPESKEELTVRFLQKQFECEFEADNGVENGDITLLLGKSNASVFLPKQKNP